ncbi:MAG: hypothetical protein GX358_00085 [candidate division WS1 bacterium]|nr:hypothetical protein [candidate division WS1 bacterium]
MRLGLPVRHGMAMSCSFPPAFCAALHVQRAVGVGAHGISRCDMHLDSRGQVWVHEINSMPGLTETSDVPHEAFATGMTYRDLVLEILGSAFFH